MKTMYTAVSTIITAFCLIHCVSCNQVPARVEAVLAKAGESRTALEKVVTHYQKDKNPLKLRAAYYLIQHLDQHIYYDAPFLEAYSAIYQFADSIYAHGGILREILVRHDSLLRQCREMRVTDKPDIEQITDGLLIEHIELAFEAWGKPWAKHLTFDQFCEYILPYKVANEKPARWRQELQRHHPWLTDSLRGKTSTRTATIAINNGLRSLFHIELRFNTLVEQSYANLVTGKTGNCSDAANLALYCMRSQGIPVAVEFTPQWANKHGGHWWNVVLYPNGQWVNFLGAESNPGLSKMEHGEKIRAKVYRRTYAAQADGLAATNAGRESLPDFFKDPHFVDVTAQRLPVSDVTVSFQKLPVKTRYAYLCVFDNQNWRAIHWGKIEGSKVTFTDMGRHVAYLPAVYRNGQYTPIAPPFILTRQGKVHVLTPDSTRTRQATLTRKYPYDDTNTVKVGDTYELLYWQQGWQSLGVQKAGEESLVYRRVPHNALLLLHNLDRGRQERIFTLSNQNQVWW